MKFINKLFKKKEVKVEPVEKKIFSYEVVLKNGGAISARAKSEDIRQLANTLTSILDLEDGFMYAHTENGVHIFKIQDVEEIIIDRKESELYEA